MKQFDDDLTRQIRELGRFSAVGIAVGHPNHPVVLAFLYSNLGYSIIGHIAETRTKICYEKLVEQRFSM